MKSLLPAIGALLLVLPHSAATRADPPAKPQPVAEPIAATLAKHCRECHTGEKTKGDFRVDSLTADFADRANRDRWRSVAEQLSTGAMPPKGKPRPSDTEQRALTEWVGKQAAAADLARRATQGRTAMRRLNRTEYENTVRDLLGIDIELKELLPVDSSADGFDTNSDALHVSSFLMEKYLEAADAALNVAIANNPQPPLVKKRYSLKEERAVKVSTESVFLPKDDALVMFSSSGWNAITVGQFYPPDRGKYRIRISASAHASPDKPVTFRVDAGPMLMGTKNHLVGFFDAPEKGKVFEFVDHFDARNHIRISPYGLASAQTVTKTGAAQYTGPGLAVQWVEVEGPLHDSWPPECHKRIFGDLEQKTAPVFNNNRRVEVVSKTPEADAEKILRDFARRAFRRAVTAEELKPFVTLVKGRLEAKHSFEQAVRVGLKAILVSPEFLFLREKPGKLDDFAVASRLSYFLWSTTPDAELLTLAEKGKLTQPATLREQVERMLKHPKAGAFTENFVGQWLGLRDIDFTAPDFRLYPEFDEFLKESMLRETHLFFNEVLRNDLSVSNFVTSDFTFLNGRLAKHYGIPDVSGSDMRRVALAPGSHRGGVLTMASVLKVTANGTNTSPVVRGAWVLDRILGTPPAPPPAGVPAVEPDIRGATTIRDQLAKHREVATCNTCHAKIDPPGFALENYDVIGGWREAYRSIGGGKPVKIDGRSMPYGEGKKIDPADVLATGEKFRDIDELKQLLAKNPDQLTRALAGKLLTYGTGRASDDADGPVIDAIVTRVREKKHGLRSLIQEVVLSETFLSK